MGLKKRFQLQLWKVVCYLYFSDVASPQLPSTPERQKTDDTKDNNKQSGKTGDTF